MSPPLWAPWRMDYVLGKKQRDTCVFCIPDAPSQEELDERLIVAKTDRVVVMLNRYPFSAGHLLVIPKLHVSELDDLERADYEQLFWIVRESASRLKRAVKCEGTNVGVNLGAAAGAGIAEHLHVHVVPRWSGDTNFMPVVADTRVIPQALVDTRRHLSTFFADVSSG